MLKSYYIIYHLQFAVIYEQFYILSNIGGHVYFILIGGVSGVKEKGKGGDDIKLNGWSDDGSDIDPKIHVFDLLTDAR